MPIVVINPAFGRSMAKLIQENSSVNESDILIQCSCSVGSSKKGSGSNPVRIPGGNPGSNRRSNPGNNPGSNPRRNLRGNHGSNPGSNSGSNPGINPRTNTEKYFQSLDYNAGRHATHNSTHKFNCLFWRPSNSSHLHSWRRGWTQN